MCVITVRQRLCFLSIDRQSVRHTSCQRKQLYTDIQQQATTMYSRVENWILGQPFDNNFPEFCVYNCVNLSASMTISKAQNIELSQSAQRCARSARITRCRLAERFASAWPELIIHVACDVRGRGEWLHRCSWPPLQLACASYRLFAHALYSLRLQTDRQKDRHRNRVTYCVLRLYRRRTQKNVFSCRLV